VDEENPPEGRIREKRQGMERAARTPFLLGKAVMLANQKPRLDKGRRSGCAVGNIANRVKISAAACTRIIAVSPFASATKQEILDFVGAQRKALVVLPGNQTNTPSPGQIRRVLRGGALAFAEGKKAKNGRPVFIIAESRIRKMPSQVFARRPTADDIDDLADALPGRTVRIGKRRATFFICGELIAFNPDGRVKHKRKLDHDIVINPAHTLMGHWNHLGKKLVRLSRGSIAVYVTNNVKNRHLSSDVRIYKVGKLMKRHRGKNIAWSQCRI
jgi:hypothetical protein